MGPTAEIPMENPYCSCKLTGVLRHDKAMAAFDQKEAAHRTRMLALMAKRQQRAALRRGFEGWKQEFIATRTKDQVPPRAPQINIPAWVFSMSWCDLTARSGGAQLADLERREAKAAAAAGGRSGGAGGSVGPAVKWTVRGAAVLRSEEMQPEGGVAGSGDAGSYTVYRVKVTGAAEAGAAVRAATLLRHLSRLVVGCECTAAPPFASTL